MSTVEMRLELPAGLSQEEAKLLLAVKLFEVGKVSVGRAAKIAEISKRAFPRPPGALRHPCLQ